MLTILWFLPLAIAITLSLVWLLDHNGEVLITWLGYELQTDVFTAILLAIVAALLIFITTYLLTRILAIKFPALLKMFFKRSYVKSLEKVVQRHQKGFDLMSQLMLALEIHDEKSAQNLQKNLTKLVKNSALHNFFNGKISFEKQDFSKAAEYFAKFGENKHAKILVLKARFEMALKNQEETKAIAYAKQILSVKHDNFEVARSLLKIYKKRGLWQDAKALILQYGSEKFKDELQKRDVAVINSALAIEAFQQRKFLLAIKHAKIALKAADNNFLPALEVLLKSWIKLGLGFKANWKIKSIWRENPHLILAEIFDFTQRKSKPKNRIKAIKKLAKVNEESALEKLAIGMVAFRAGAYKEAREFLNLSLLRQKSYRAYKLLAATEKALGNLEESKKNFAKAAILEQEDHYSCNSCGHKTSKWSAKCDSCGTYDSLEWNN